ncbi:hypothetical protein MCOR27_005470 [Pyricularia oryzae]|nr:hypothetical protein MCOR26_008744 [Pyricularia oryzae]KAI6278750.1 hypothetical protein MCOR27_005470 [Pyricularia oryzae]KAI6315421.1 hypothetical protein MCOR29_006978 [Pyricularia oryzae]KAI6336932.1 hypothetical protein MCOR28_008906 [Pyricularia oryzae]KAI6627401.1 hypothetical protein MCOR07_001951 [Pyricularia oryzae]
MPRFLASLFGQRHEPRQTSNPKPPRGPIKIAAVGHHSADVAAILDPSNSSSPAGWQATTGERGRRVWVYSQPDIAISFEFTEASRAQLDDALQGDAVAVLLVGNLACYDQLVRPATSYIQDLLDCFAALRSKTRHIPVVFVLRGARDFRARQQESPIYRCFPEGGESMHETGEDAGMRLLVGKIGTVDGSGRDEEALGETERAELYLHFAEDQQGGALDMRRVRYSRTTVKMHFSKLLVPFALFVLNANGVQAASDGASTSGVKATGDMGSPRGVQDAGGSPGAPASSVAQASPGSSKPSRLTRIGLIGRPKRPNRPNRPKSTKMCQTSLLSSTGVVVRTMSLVPGEDNLFSYPDGPDQTEHVITVKPSKLTCKPSITEGGIPEGWKWKYMKV